MILVAPMKGQKSGACASHFGSTKLLRRDLNASILPHESPMQKIEEIQKSGPDTGVAAASTGESLRHHEELSNFVLQHLCRESVQLSIECARAIPPDNRYDPINSNWSRVRLHYPDGRNLSKFQW